MRDRARRRAVKTFASGERGDLSGFSPDVVNDWVLEPGDPGEPHKNTCSDCHLVATTSRRRHCTTRGTDQKRVPEVETFRENHVHLHPSDPVEDDGPLTSFN